MHQQRTTPSSIIPHIVCPRCDTDMRLAIIEPAAMSGTGRDMLVFECTCGFAFRRPADVDREAV